MNIPTCEKIACHNLFYNTAFEYIMYNGESTVISALASAHCHHAVNLNVLSILFIPFIWSFPLSVIPFQDIFSVFFCDNYANFPFQQAIYFFYI